MDVICGSSFLCSEDRRVHFGLGELATVDTLEVVWPGGARQSFVGLAANRYVIIEEGVAGARQVH